MNKWNRLQYACAVYTYIFVLSRFVKDQSFLQALQKSGYGRYGTYRYTDYILTSHYSIHHLLLRKSRNGNFVTDTKV